MRLGDVYLHRGPELRLCLPIQVIQGAAVLRQGLGEGVVGIGGIAGQAEVPHRLFPQPRLLRGQGPLFAPDLLQSLWPCSVRTR